MRSTGSPFASRTGAGSKLWAAESAAVVADEGDGYETGVHEDWSVVGPGVAQVVLEAEADRRRHDPTQSERRGIHNRPGAAEDRVTARDLSLIHISEPTRLGMSSYAVFCLKKK